MRKPPTLTEGSQGSTDNVDLYLWGSPGEKRICLLTLKLNWAVESPSIKSALYFVALHANDCVPPRVDHCFSCQGMSGWILRDLQALKLKKHCVSGSEIQTNF